jgi:flagellar biogenesis protein FliO
LLSGGYFVHGKDFMDGLLQYRDLKNDALARKVTRSLLIFQVSALFIGIILILARLSSIAIFIAFAALVLLVGALAWLYVRYQSYPIVQEKHELNQQANNLQAQIFAASTNIKIIQQNQEKLVTAEQAESSALLQDCQKEYIESGMVNTQIAEAEIPGIGLEQKRQLAAHGFTTAKNTTWNVINLEGFTPTETQAILNWRNAVFINFVETKPTELPAEKQYEIKKEYQIQRASNAAEQQKLDEHKTILEQTRNEIQARLDELAPLPFKSFLRYSLASRGIAAGVIGFGCILSLIFLSSSATYGAILQSIPTATVTPTVTSSPTATFTQTVTSSPTPTDTPTFTNTPTITNTPRSNFTPGSTYTPTLAPTVTPGITPTP